MLYPMLYHGLEHGARAPYIVIIVFKRLYHAFAHLRIGGEVYYGVPPFFVEHRVYKGLVPQVSLIKPRLGVHCIYKAGFKIIHNGHVIAVVNKLIYSMPERSTESSAK